MAEEQKNSSAETVDAAASAAHTVKGAIKAGKAISGAAKGAAAGGPYGAVAGAVWAGRKHIGKIIAIIAILLLLPVLFLLMLPGLIFGGLTNAFSPADPDTPILNSETAIVENANDITFAINAILGEALDDVMARIEVDFASSGADKMEVKNPYSSGLVYNANLIVSQYCAARDEDFESISLDDLSTVLRENKEHLYSYTSVRESREVTSEDPETGEEATSTEIWMVYTIRYNGESYLADHVFALTDEQKELASDYASNLSLFLGDGLLQNVDEWTGNSIPSLGDVTFTDGGTPVVYYNQLDERYASQPYGTDNIGGYGCGPTAMAIVVSSLTDDTLRRNLEVVSLEVLKTKYQKPYEELRGQICKAATEYTRHVALCDIRIRRSLFDEAKTYIDAAIQQTQCLKKISEAAFQRQDMDEIAALAHTLREEIEKSLHYFYLDHMCLLVTRECIDDPNKVPEIYNKATSCVWRDGAWLLMEDTETAILLSAPIINELPPTEAAA